MNTAIDHAASGTTGVGHASSAGDTMRPARGQDVPRPARRLWWAILWSITTGRVLLLPIFLLLAARARGLSLRGAEPGWVPELLVAILAAIALTDMLDGWIARRFELTSQAGAITDAAADKLVQIALVAYFTFTRGPVFDSLPLWFFATVVGRDLVLGGGWVALRLAGLHLEVVHRFHGRATTVAVFSVLFWITAQLGSGGLGVLLILTAGLIWISTAAYAADAVVGRRASRFHADEHHRGKETIP